MDNRNSISMGSSTTRVQIKGTRLRSIKIKLISTSLLRIYGTTPVPAESRSKLVEAQEAAKEKLVDVVIKVPINELEDLYREVSKEVKAQWL